MVFPSQTFCRSLTVTTQMTKPKASKPPKPPTQPSNYLLRSAVLSESFQHSLTASEFNALSTARAFLYDYIQFEEGVLQVLWAFEEFESFLLTTALNHYLFPLHKDDVVRDIRLRSNLKVLGFLNSVTSFRDQFPRFKTLLPRLNVCDRFRRSWSAQKANTLAFCFCEHFRNFAQHQTQPVFSVSIGGGWDKGRVLREDHTSVYVSVDAVCKNRKIKDDAKKLAGYKAAFGDHCDISLIFRETVGCIGKIVKEVRTITNEAFASAIADYEANLAIIEQHKQGLISAEAMSIIGTNETEKISIFREFSERAKRLRQTFVMENNQDHFISNRARGHSAKS